MRAYEAMTSPAVTVPARAPVPAVAALLDAHGFSAAPVLDDDGRLLGVVSSADLDRVRLRPAGTGAARTVGEVMTVVAPVAHPDDDLTDVVELLLDDEVRSVPVVDAGEVVGVLARWDVLRVVARGDYRDSGDCDPVGATGAADIAATGPARGGRLHAVTAPGRLPPR